MIIINKKKKIEQYKFEQMPNFSHKRSVIAWHHVQQMKYELLNIKSIDIQVKDIRQMIYSHRPILVSLYAQLDGEYNDDDYINISKSKRGNKILIFEILNANWILKLDDLKSKTESELEAERCYLQNRIDDMKKKANSSNEYDYNIKLLEYQLSCLEDYMFRRTNDGKVLVKKHKR